MYAELVSLALHKRMSRVTLWKSNKDHILNDQVARDSSPWSTACTSPKWGSDRGINILKNSSYPGYGFKNPWEQSLRVRWIVTISCHQPRQQHPYCMWTFRIQIYLMKRSSVFRNLNINYQNLLIGQCHPDIPVSLLGSLNKLPIQQVTSWFLSSRRWNIIWLNSVSSPQYGHKASCIQALSELQAIGSTDHKEAGTSTTQSTLHDNA